MCPAERRCAISSLWMLVSVCGSQVMLTCRHCSVQWKVIPTCACSISANSTEFVTLHSVSDCLGGLAHRVNGSAGIINQHAVLAFTAK